MAANTSVEAELRAAWDAWFQAIDDFDRSFMDTRLTDSYLMYDYFGRVMDREEYKGLFDLAEPGYKGVHEFHEFKVTEINETTAVAFGEYYAQMKFKGGNEVDATVRFSTLWVRGGDDVWRCAFYHGAFRQD